MSNLNKSILQIRREIEMTSLDKAEVDRILKRCGIKGWPTEDMIMLIKYNKWCVSQQKSNNTNPLPAGGDGVIPFNNQ